MSYHRGKLQMMMKSSNVIMHSKGHSVEMVV
jgi:hypothetical protein